MAEFFQARTGIHFNSRSSTDRIDKFSSLEVCIGVVEELEAVVPAYLERATRLRKSILQKELIGKLTK